MVTFVVAMVTLTVVVVTVDCPSLDSVWGVRTGLAEWFKGGDVVSEWFNTHVENIICAKGSHTRRQKEEFCKLQVCKSGLWSNPKDMASVFVWEVVDFVPDEKSFFFLPWEFWCSRLNIVQFILITHLRKCWSLERGSGRGDERFGQFIYIKIHLSHD